MTSSVIARKSRGLFIMFLNFSVLLMQTNFTDTSYVPLNLVLISLLVSYKLLYLFSVVLDHSLVHSLEDLLAFQALLLSETLLRRSHFLYYLYICFNCSWNVLREWVFLFLVFMVA